MIETMSTAMYEALNSAGVDEEKAKKASSVLGELHQEIVKLQEGQRTIKWMIGIVIILIVGSLFK